MMKPAIYGAERLERMRSNMLRFKVPRLRPKSISICGYGPSLRQTWRDLLDDVMTTSGAHDFLIERGIIPKYHVECDPRERKVEYVKRPHKDVTYLINSCCHPSMFEALEGFNVVMWHGVTDDDAQNQIDLAESIERGVRLLNGGTNVGMRALPVARELGYTDFDLHGMDCCYRGETQWAGEHFGPRHKTIMVEVDGLVFETSDLMLHSCDDFFEAMRMLSGCRFVVHGDGLLEARLKMFLRDPEKALSAQWCAPLNKTTISDDYRKMNAMLHEIYPAYGSFGKSRSQEVMALAQTQDILDYGCGKGTLAKELPFSIAEYDPAIKGKDQAPEPAEFVVCSDVLEHIEPVNLASVLTDLKRVMRRRGLLVIHTGAASKQLPDGRNAHLLQRSQEWWSKTLSDYFTIDEMTVQGKELHVSVSALEKLAA